MSKKKEKKKKKTDRKNYIWYTFTLQTKGHGMWEKLLNSFFKFIHLKIGNFENKMFHL